MIMIQLDEKHLLIYFILVVIIAAISIFMQLRIK